MKFKFISKRAKQVFFSLCGLLAFSIVGVISSFISTALQPAKIPFIGILILTAIAAVVTSLGYWFGVIGDSKPTKDTLDKPFNLGTMIMITAVSHQTRQSPAPDQSAEEAANIIGEEYAKFFSVQREYRQAIKAKELEKVMKFVTDITTKLSLNYGDPVEACFLYGASIILYIYLDALLVGISDELLLQQGHTRDEVRALEKKIEGYADRSELPKLKSYFKTIKGQRQTYSQKAKLITQEINEYLRKVSF